jgi:SAM-dependent methyltransferase
LDFGCSSGRVVRVLAAAYPDADWFGCDPNRGAIEWAREHLPGVEFEVSPQHPPLPWPDGHFGAIFAISIWSHFAAPAAIAWLDEMRRLLAPGGLLVLSTHGLTSIDHAATNAIRSDAQLEEIARTLYAEGHWYAAEFGQQGDHGVVDPDWGTAFLTPEWLLDRACPEWSLRDFRPGTVEGNQDLYVLQRPA